MFRPFTKVIANTDSEGDTTIWLLIKTDFVSR